MSLTGNYDEHHEDNSSDSDENYQTEEEISDVSYSESITKLEKISNKRYLKNTAKRYSKKNILNVSLRYGKINRHFRAKNQSRKVKKRKKNFKNTKNCVNNTTEITKKGKRCRIGGKAKGKPPEEEKYDKPESDDESDSFYLGRVSLGYFQKFVDTSGASTSYQWEEDYKNSYPLHCCEQIQDEISTDLELLELQKWGREGLVSFSSKKNERVDRTEDIL